MSTTVNEGATRIVDASAVAVIVRAIGLDRLYDMAIERLEAVLRQCNDGDVEMKERDGFVLTNPHLGLVEWMPAVRHGAAVTVKMVSYHPNNPAKFRLPTILSTLYTFDAATGHLRSIVDGTFATAIRTGAASAIASRLLARPDAAVLGLVGCGAQAVTQLHALSRVFSLSEVLISDIDSAAEQTFAARARFSGVRVRVASLAEIEAQADIICTATSVAPGAAPTIPGLNVRSHVHINAVGSDMPGKVELPLELLRASVVCPDHTAQAAREGECQQLQSVEIGPSLFDLLRDGTRAAQLRDTQTVYDSTGLALQDLAMAELFEELAAELGVGTTMVIEANSGDPQDPYAFLSNTF